MISFYRQFIMSLLPWKITAALLSITISISMLLHNDGNLNASLILFSGIIILSVYNQSLARTLDVIFALSQSVKQYIIRILCLSFAGLAYSILIILIATEFLGLNTLQYIFSTQFFDLKIILLWLVLLFSTPLSNPLSYETNQTYFQHNTFLKSVIALFAPLLLTFISALSPFIGFILASNALLIIKYKSKNLVFKNLSHKMQIKLLSLCIAIFWGAGLGGLTLSYLFGNHGSLISKPALIFKDLINKEEATDTQQPTPTLTANDINSASDFIRWLDAGQYKFINNNRPQTATEISSALKKLESYCSPGISGGFIGLVCKDPKAEGTQLRSLSIKPNDQRLTELANIADNDLAYLIVYKSLKAVPDGALDATHKELIKKIKDYSQVSQKPWFKDFILSIDRFENSQPNISKYSKMDTIPESEGILIITYPLQQ